MIRESFFRIHREYNDQLNLPYQPTTNSLSTFMLKEVPNIVKDQCQIDEGTYEVFASVGQGNWTHTPWISIMNRGITNTATKGFYVVYLFRKDMQGVYLSLNQGTTYLSNKYKGNKPKDKMTEVARNLRNLLNYSLSDFPEQEINLVSKVDNARNYAAAHICGKYYSFSNFPSKEEMKEDLQKLLGVYEELHGLMAGKDVDQFMDYILSLEEIEDTQFQSDIQIVAPSETLEVPQPVPSKRDGSRSKILKRDASKAKEALKKANYLCEVNPTHRTFVSKVSGENFVEAHHLIPMNLQDNYAYSLDVPGNIVSLCPNCHRQIHHAETKVIRKLVTTLYESRKATLSRFGIDVSLSDFLKEYK